MYKYITCKPNTTIMYKNILINLHPFQCWAHLPTVDEVKWILLHLALPIYLCAMKTETVKITVCVRIRSYCMPVYVYYSAWSSNALMPMLYIVGKCLFNAPKLLNNSASLRRGGEWVHTFIFWFLIILDKKLFFVFLLLLLVGDQP